MDEDLERKLFEKYSFLRPSQDSSVVEKNMEIMAKQTSEENIKSLENIEESIGKKGIITGKIKEYKNKYNPDIYEEKIEPINDLMVFGIMCDNGWFNLLDDLFSKMEKHLNVHPELKKNFKIEEVKEKYGGLKVYCAGGDDFIYNLIGKAESESYNICEVCGNKGKLCTTAYDIEYSDGKFYKVPAKSGGWYKTLCETDAKKLKYMFDNEKIADEEAFEILTTIKNENDTTLLSSTIDYSDNYIESVKKDNKKIERYLDILKKRLKGF
jgi:hypothetical protein